MSSEHGQGWTCELLLRVAKAAVGWGTPAPKPAWPPVAAPGLPWARRAQDPAHTGRVPESGRDGGGAGLWPVLACAVSDGRGVARARSCSPAAGGVGTRRNSPWSSRGFSRKQHLHPHGGVGTGCCAQGRGSGGTRWRPADSVHLHETPPWGRQAGRRAQKAVRCKRRHHGDLNGASSSVRPSVCEPVWTLRRGTGEKPERGF